MPPKLKIYDEDGKREVEMIYDKVSFGRDAKCTVQIRDTMASREHCRIEKRGAEYRVIDCGSRNGTKVNGSEISDYKLNHGDEVQIGEVVIRFETGGSPASSGRKRPASSGSGKMAATSGSGRVKQRPSTINKTTRRMPRLGSGGGPRRTGGGPMVAVVVIALLLAVVGLAVVAAGGGSPDAAALAKINQADSAARSGDYDRAERLLAESRPQGSALQARRNALFREIEEMRKSSERDALETEASKALSSVRQRIREGKLTGDAEKNAYKDIYDRYRGTSAGDLAKTYMDRLGGVVASSSAASSRRDPIDPPPHSAASSSSREAPLPKDLDGAVAELVRRENYGRAVDMLLKAWRDSGEEKYSNRVEEVSQKADAALAKAIKEAKAMAAAGNVFGARSHLDSAAERFGGKWADKASAARNRLE